MPIARITEIRPNGSFASQYGTNGTMYCSLVSFDDNTQGVANHKGPQPPYRTGDEAEYTVTGSHQGTAKLKISKPGQVFGGNRQTAPNPVMPQPRSTYVAPRTNETAPINGATVGMAMNQSLQLLTKDLGHDEVCERVCTRQFWESVMEVASDVIRVSRHLESGHLAPSVKDRANGHAPAPVQQPPRSQPQPRPQPTEEQYANITDGADEDVPF